MLSNKATVYTLKGQVEKIMNRMAEAEAVKFLRKGNAEEFMLAQDLLNVMDSYWRSMLLEAETLDTMAEKLESMEKEMGVRHAENEFIIKKLKEIQRSIDKK